MAYCPECKQKVQIVMKTDTSISEQHVHVERYSEHSGQKIGYNEFHLPVSESSSAPHCSNCFAALKFPRATNAEEFKMVEQEAFQVLKNNYIKALNKSIKKEFKSSDYYNWEGAGPSTLLALLTGFVGFIQLSGIIEHPHLATTKNIVLICVLFAICIGLILLTWNCFDTSKKRAAFEQGRDEDKKRLEKINNFEYSHENYANFHRKIYSDEL